MRGRLIAAAEANRQFSDLLRQVRDGATFTVTSHGRPVARIVPIRAGEGVTNRSRTALLERLRRARVVDVGKWTRDELYDDEP